jgi:thiamine-phosphate pyrophosphorylase
VSGRAVSFRLYLITDGAGDEVCRRVERALGGAPPGSVAVQLRAKQLEGGALLAAGRELMAITARYGAPLFINDRVDVALLLGAAGAHLPARGLPVKVARRIAPDLWLGASTHSLAEARMAVAGGVDFMTFGPVWATPSKAGMGEPVGVAALGEVVRRVAVPVFALGGVDRERAGECVAVGARLACIRAVLEAEDPAAAVARLIEAAG